MKITTLLTGFEQLQTDICIIGAGLVGQIGALALAKHGYNITLCAPKRVSEDKRTTALLQDSVSYLEEIGLWELIKEKAHPLKIMRIVDGTDRLFRSSQVDFNSQEIDIDAFGYNVLNADLNTLLDKELEQYSNIEILSGHVISIEKQDKTTALVVEMNKDETQTLETKFVVGADGRNSIVRETLGLGHKDWKYNQTAFVLDFTHDFPTNYTSTEFHTPTGPFTIVPRDQNMAGLVWLETPQNVERLCQMDTHALELLIEKKMHSFLGKVKICSPVQSFPIKGMIAKSFGTENCAIIGEAAHVFPPIGAQGFNLGLRDIKTLVEVLNETSFNQTGDAYSAKRVSDVSMSTYGVDLLNRSLLSSFLPMQLLRGAGLHALGNIAPLRKFAMKMGISPNFKDASQNL